MLQSLRRYAGVESEPPEPIERQGAKVSPVVSNERPVIWETGDIAQIRFLLVLREAELVVAKAQLSGNDYIDWYTKNRILDLEIKIADLRKWLAEAMGKENEP